MDTETTEEATDEATESETQRDSRTWFPYITKSQFEKFLARLQSKMPEEIDRDYVRAIIRTPSMIYRFLRGVEAMKLIDKDQRPTERLHNLVAAESRKETISEILKDLYPELLEQYGQSDGSMVDRDIVSFFIRETGMGSDSANKMKMFFKYLMSEADPDSEPAADEQEGKEKSTPARASKELRVAQRRSAQRPGQDSSNSGDRSTGSRTLSETQKAYLDTLKSVLKINIDGDWDDDMVKLAFDRLERLFDRVRRG